MKTQQYFDVLDKLEQDWLEESNPEKKAKKKGKALAFEASRLDTMCLVYDFFSKKKKEVKANGRTSIR